MMYEQEGRILKEDLDIAAYTLHIDQSIIDTIIEIGLFKLNGNAICNDRISAAVDEAEALSKRRRNAAQSRWKKPSVPEDSNNASASESCASAMQVHSNSNAGAMQNDIFAMHNNIMQSKITQDKENIDTPSPSEHTSLNDLINFFNSEMKSHGALIPEVRTISGQRKTHTLARIREHGKETFAKMIRIAAVNDFLNGKNDRAWVANYDWLVNPSNFVKVIEGNYSSRNGNRNSQYNNESGSGSTDGEGYDTTL